jgi:predicted MFS family arabinose efflux permease
VRRLTVFVSAVVLMETIFFTALSPLLPGYVRTLGLSKFEAGVLVGSYAAGALAGAVPSGLLASRRGAKPTMVLGLALLAGASGVFGLAHGAWMLDLARLSQGVGASLAWTGALTWLVQEAPAPRRGELIGFVTAAAAGGAVLGPAVGAVAITFGTRATFVALGLIGAGLALAAARFPGSGPGERQPLRMMITPLRRPGLLSGLWLIAFASSTFGVLGVLAPLRLSGLGLSGEAIGGIFVVASALESGGTIVAGRWADRSGRRAPLRASLLASAALLLVLPLARSDWSLAILVVVVITACGTIFAPAIALLADEAESAGLEHAFSFALLNASWAPGLLIGSGGGGAVASALGDTTPYLLLAALAASTVLVLRHVPKREPAVQRLEASID